MKFIDFLRVWLTKYWIVCSTVIVIVPASYKAALWIGKVNYILNANFEMAKTLKPIIPKIDIIISRQSGLIDGQKHIQLSIDSNRDEIKCYGRILKKHVIDEAKTKQQTLDAISEFGKYYNLNYQTTPDITKKNFRPIIPGYCDLLGIPNVTH